MAERLIVIDQGFVNQRPLNNWQGRNLTLDLDSSDSVIKMAYTKQVIALEGFTPEVSAELSKKIKTLKSAVTISSKVLKGFTHLVCDRIICSDKFFVACAQGAWIVTPQFVEDSFVVGKWLSEQDYVHSVKDEKESAELVAASQRWRWKWQMFKEHPYTGWTVAVLIEGEERLKYKRILSLGGASVVPLVLPLADNQNVAGLIYIFMDEANRKSVPHLQEFGLICVQLSFITDTILKDEDLDPFQYLMQSPSATETEDGVSNTIPNDLELISSSPPASHSIEFNDNKSTLEGTDATSTGYNHTNQDPLPSSPDSCSNRNSSIVLFREAVKNDVSFQKRGYSITNISQYPVQTIKEIKSSKHIPSLEQVALCPEQVNQTNNSFVKQEASINTRSQLKSRLQIQPMDPNRPVDSQQKESREGGQVTDQVKKKRKQDMMVDTHIYPKSRKMPKMIETLLSNAEINNCGRISKSKRGQMDVLKLPVLPKSIYAHGVNGEIAHPVKDDGVNGEIAPPVKDEGAIAKSLVKAMGSLEKNWSPRKSVVKPNAIKTILPNSFSKGKFWNTAEVKNVKTPVKNSTCLARCSVLPLSASVHLYGIPAGQSNSSVGSSRPARPGLLTNSVGTETVTQTAQTPGRNGVDKGLPCIQTTNLQPSQLVSGKTENDRANCDSFLETTSNQSPLEKNLISSSWPSAKPSPSHAIVGPTSNIANETLSSTSLSQNSASPLKRVKGKFWNTAGVKNVKTPVKNSTCLARCSVLPLSASVHLYGIQAGQSNSSVGSSRPARPGLLTNSLGTETVTQTAQTPDRNGVDKGLPCIQTTNLQPSQLVSGKTENDRANCDSFLETTSNQSPLEKNLISSSWPSAKPSSCHAIVGPTSNIANETLSSTSLSQNSASPLKRVQSSLQSFGFSSSFSKGQRSTPKKLTKWKPSLHRSPSTVRNLGKKVTPVSSPLPKQGKQEPVPDRDPKWSPNLSLSSTVPGTSCDSPVVVSSSDDEDNPDITFCSDDEDILLGDDPRMSKGSTSRETEQDADEIKLSSDDENILLGNFPSISKESERKVSSLKPELKNELSTQPKNDSEIENYSLSQNLHRTSGAKMSTSPAPAQNVRKSLSSAFNSVAKSSLVNSTRSQCTSEIFSVPVSHRQAFFNHGECSSFLDDSLPSPDKVGVKHDGSENVKYKPLSGSKNDSTCVQQPTELSFGIDNARKYTWDTSTSLSSSQKKTVIKPSELMSYEHRIAATNWSTKEKIDQERNLNLNASVSKQKEIQEDNSGVNLSCHDVLKFRWAKSSSILSPGSEDSATTNPEKEYSNKPKRSELESSIQHREIRESVPVLYGQWMEAAQELGLNDSAISHGRPTELLLPTSLVLSQLVSLASEGDSGEENVSSQAVAYLQGWLHLHPPTNVNTARIYAASLKIDTQDHNYLMNWIQKCILVSKGCSDTAHLQALLLYFVSVLEQNFNSYLKMNDKKMLQKSLVVSWLWENPFGVFHTSRTGQLIKLLERLLLSSSSSKQIDLVTCEAVCSLIGIAAECIRLSSNGWDQTKQWFNSDAVMVIATDIARKITNYMLIGGSEAILLLNFLKAPWLRAVVTAQILSSTCNCYLLSEVIEVRNLSLHSIVSQYFYLVPNISVAAKCPSTSKTNNHGLRDEGNNEKLNTITNQRDADGTTLRRGRKPSKSSVLLSKRNHKGETALHTACIKNKAEQLQELLSLPDVDVNVRDANGWTPLHEACYHGSLRCVELLLQYVPQALISQAEDPGAEINKAKTDAVDSLSKSTHNTFLRKVDLNARGPENLTPLHEAVWNDDIPVSRLLLEYGGQQLLKAKTVLGNTAFNLVQSPQMARVLEGFSMASSGSLNSDGFNHNKSQTDMDLLLFEGEERAPLSSLYTVLVGDMANKAVSFDDFSHFLSLLSTLFTAYCEAKNLSSYKYDKITSAVKNSFCREQEASSQETSDQAVLSALLPVHVNLLERHMKKLTKEEDFEALKPWLEMFKAICYSVAT